MKAEEYNIKIAIENHCDQTAGELLAEHIVTTHFKDYAFKMENWGFKSFGVALGDGVIDLKAILKILKEKSKLDRIMLEIPVEKEGTEKATLEKEDDYVRRSVLYARDVLGIK